MINFEKIFKKNTENLLNNYFSKVEKEYIESIMMAPESITKINNFYKTVEGLPLNLVIQLIENKFNEIKNGKYKEREDLKNLILELVLILKNIPLGTEGSQKYWNKQKRKIITNIRSKKVLIEIAAQHPLIDGKPGFEFKKRLIEGIRLYHKEIKKGNEVFIYVPGSIHGIKSKESQKWKLDLQSLSEAGKEYLIDNGIPEHLIKAQDANQQYKTNGVYNSADECFVASAIAKHYNCGRIISVVSPVQVYRKGLLYNQFGFNPEIYSVAIKKTFHNYVDEVFWSLYLTYAKDHTWQDTFLSMLTRSERSIQYWETLTDEQKQAIDEILQGKIIVPKEMLNYREKWKGKLNLAKKNLIKRLGNETILIYIDAIDDETEVILHLNQIIEDEKKLSKDIINKKKKFEIYTDNAKYIDKLHKLFKCDETIVIKSKKEISISIFKTGINKYSNFYNICRSSQSIYEAMKLINNGIMPIILSIPYKKDNYPKMVADLYYNIIPINYSDYL